MGGWTLVSTRRPRERMTFDNPGKALYLKCRAELNRDPPCARNKDGLFINKLGPNEIKLRVDKVIAYEADHPEIPRKHSPALAHILVSSRVTLAAVVAEGQATRIEVNTDGDKTRGQLTKVAAEVSTTGKKLDRLLKAVDPREKALAKVVLTEHKLVLRAIAGAVNAAKAETKALNAGKVGRARIDSLTEATADADEAAKASIKTFMRVFPQEDTLIQAIAIAAKHIDFDVYANDAVASGGEPASSDDGYGGA